MKNESQIFYLIFFFTWFIISLFYSSCYYDIEQELYPKSMDSTLCQTDSATFAYKIYPIIETNCISCHSNSFSSGGVSLEGYSNVIASYQAGTLMGTINHSAGFQPMPQNLAKLSDCDIANLNAWINSGALNN